MALAFAPLGVFAKRKFFLPMTISQIWDIVIYPRKRSESRLNEHFSRGVLG
jgi:hypothetical protein